tara:strand:- start:1409 stop:2014 length:606 start_codon:yes stop_codon:yes gene_type:complete
VKITRRQLKQIIKEELENSASDTRDDEEIAVDDEALRSRADLAVNWLPLSVGDIEIDMPESEIPEVKKKVVKALDTLQRKAPEEYELVQKNLKRITSGHTSGVDIKNKKFSIADPSILDQSAEWLASIIYHDAYHVVQGTRGWHGKDRETPANLKQLELLKKLDAASDEIAHLTRVIEKGDHSDVDGDGDYDMDDYLARKY